MLRLVITATISLLVSFGTISKNQKVSRLLNHVAQHHAVNEQHKHSHHHQHGHDHKHDHEESRKTDNKHHTHHFDFSLLTQVLPFEDTQTKEVIISLPFTKVPIPALSLASVIDSYSFSIFRPPIA